MTEFVGRDGELVELAKLLGKSRVATLTGTGGVGKTRLAIQVAAEALPRYPDGAWFVDSRGSTTTTSCPARLPPR